MGCILSTNNKRGVDISKMIDRCSYSPDKILGVDISSACKQHDEEYESHSVTRLRSDWNLLVNIGKVRWWLWPIALIYFIMVRLFGRIRLGEKW